LEIYINPRDIDLVIEQYKSGNNTFIVKSFSQDVYKKRCKFFDQGKECCVDFYVKKSGVVKIIPVGKNVSQSTNLINFFNQKCMNANIDSFSYSFECKEYIVDNLINYIKNDFSDLIEVNVNQNIIKFIGYNGDIVTCTFYSTKSKIMIQAKPLITYSIIITYLSQFEEINFDELVKINNTFAGSNIASETIRNDMKVILKNSYSYLDEALLKSISGSLILFKRKGYSEDYTGYVTGEFKALEGYLRKVLTQKYNYKFKKNDPAFHMFYKDSTNKSDIDKDITLPVGVKKVLNELYKIYKNKRNVYLHSRIDPSQTRIIENFEEAQSLSDEILEIIEGSYNILFN